MRSLVVLLVLSVAGGAVAQQQVPFPPGAMASVGDAKTSPYMALYRDAAFRSSILYGRVPASYEILGLSVEQMQKVKDLCAEAKAEWSEVQKALAPKRDPSAPAADFKAFYAQQKEKQTEIAGKYTARIAELLSDGQKASLAKVEQIVKQKVDADEKAREAWNKAQQESMAAMEAQLDKALSDEQKLKLKDLATASAGRMQPIRIGQ